MKSDLITIYIVVLGMMFDAVKSTEECIFPVRDLLFFSPVVCSKLLLEKAALIEVCKFLNHSSVYSVFIVSFNLML